MTVDVSFLVIYARYYFWYRACDFLAGSPVGQSSWYSGQIASKSVAPKTDDATLLTVDEVHIKRHFVFSKHSGFRLIQTHELWLLLKFTQFISQNHLPYWIGSNRNVGNPSLSRSLFDQNRRCQPRTLQTALQSHQRRSALDKVDCYQWSKCTLHE